MILKESILCKFEEVMEKKNGGFDRVLKAAVPHGIGYEEYHFLQYRQ
ncbi:MAG: hypothetical protein ACLSWS_09370 [Faecalispora jeddahensis]